MSKVNDSLLKALEYRQILGTLRHGIEKIPSASPQNASQVSKNKKISMMTRTTSESTNINTSIQVSTNKNFYLSLRLINSNGIIVQSETKSIDHNTNIDDLYSSTIKPNISAQRLNDSTMRISVNQMDPNSNKVIVLYKTIDNQTFSKGSGYKKIGEYDAKLKGDAIEISKNISPGSHVIVRAICISRKGIYGSFSDVVVKPSIVPSDYMLDDKDSSISIFSRNTGTGIIVEIPRVVGDPVAVKFLKREVTNTSSSIDKFKILDNNKNELFHKNKPFQIIDKDVHDGHTYEYKCKLIFKNGTERQSNNSSISKRVKPFDSIGLSLDSPSVARLGREGNYSVALNCDVSIPSSDADTVRSVFSNLGLLDLFSSEFEDVKSQFETISMVKIMRLDVTTGEIYDCGEYPAGSFTDRGDSLKGRPCPVSGSEYIYIVKTLIRVPDQVISEIKTAQSYRNSNKFDKIQSAVSGRDDGSSIDPNFSEKFFTPIAIRRSTVSYGIALVKNHAGNTFEIGEIGVEKIVRVSTPKKSISIRPKRISVNFRKEVIVEWRVRGDISEIDHFIITSTRNGVTVPTGVHHSTSKNSSFKYVDTNQLKIPGDVTYGIIPVFSNYDVGLQTSLGNVSID